MKKMTLKSLVALLMVIAMLCPCLASCGGDNATVTTNAANTTASATTTAPKTDDISPKSDDLANFAVISDVHIGRTGLGTSPEKKFKKALGKINEKLGTPDAILIVGDLTEHGYDAEYKKFKSVLDQNVLDGTKVGIVMGNHEYYRGGTAEDARDAYTSKIGELHTDTVVGGVHMIGISLYSSTGDYKNATDYLCEHVRAAAAEDPNMPIIVYTHMGFSDVYDDEPTTFGKDLESLIEEFPQIISFSGHMHYALDDPRMIIQNKITTVQTSTVGSNYWNYSYMDPLVTEDGDRASQGLFVSVSRDKVVTITRYDFKRDCEVGEKWVIDTPKVVESRDNFTYTMDARTEKAASPTFAEGAQISASDISSFFANVSFPNATVVDDVSDGCIIGYNVELKRKSDGEVVFTKYVINDWQCCNPVSNHMLAIGGMKPSEEYIVSVTAESAWGKKSEALTAEITTLPFDGDGDLPGLLLSVDYKGGNTTDSVNGTDAEVHGSPEQNGDTVKLNGNSCYGYALDQSFYDLVTDKISIETVVYIMNDQTYTWGYASVLGNAQGGGFDICCYDNGTLTFDVNIGGSYKTATATAPMGRWAHVVASYDGEELAIYIDGMLADSINCSGNIKHVSTESRKFFVGADVNDSGDPETPANIEISYVNIYTSGLTANQAAYLAANATLPTSD